MKLHFEPMTTQWWTLAGAALGGLVGFSVFVVLFNTTTAVEIIQTTRIGGIETIQSKISPQLVIDRRAAPISLIERMQTLGFAKRLAQKAHIDPFDLAAPQYGGKGQLRVRQIGDGSLVEIRVKATDADTALKAAATAGALAIDDDRSLMAPLRKLIEARIAELSRQRATSLAVSEALSSAAVHDKNSTDYAALFSASEALAKTQIVSDALWALQSGAVQPVSQEAAVFEEAAVASPVLSHWWQAMLIGGFAGAALAFAYALSGSRKHMVFPQSTVCDASSARGVARPRATHPVCE